MGGIVFTPSFVPNADACGFGGDSYLYGQYFETGTAYKNAIFAVGWTILDTATSKRKILDKTSLGKGMASSMGIHIGKEGSKGFIQTSTGTIVETGLNTGASIKSGITWWKEK